MDAGPAYVKGDAQRPDATEPTDDGRHRDAMARTGDDRHRASDRCGCRSLRDGPMYRSTDDGCRCCRHWDGNYRGDCCRDAGLCPHRDAGCCRDGCRHRDDCPKAYCHDCFRPMTDVWSRKRDDCYPPTDGLTPPLRGDRSDRGYRCDCHFPPDEPTPFCARCDYRYHEHLDDAGHT